MKFSAGRISFLVGIVSVFLVFVTAKDYGVSADENYYRTLGGYFATWILQPSWETIDQYWPVDDRHPPLIKIMSGLSVKLFVETLQLTDWITAHRLLVLPFVFLMSSMMTIFLLKQTNLPIALLGGFGSVLLPRVFYHAHLGTMDVAVASLWVSTFVASTFGVKHWRWFVLSLLTTGLTQVTKIHGQFLYLTMILFWTYQSFIHKKWQWLLLSIIVPVLVFIALWPWLWPDPIGRFSYYMSLMINKYNVEVYYLGQTYNTAVTPRAPWHYPFIITFVTTPVIILLFSLFGIATSLLKRNWQLLFLTMNALIPLLACALPQAMIYDGERHFLTTFPFLVALACIGIWRISQMMGTHQHTFTVIMSAITGVWILAMNMLIHPYQIAYYNELVGGLRGATKRGFETDYWASSYLNVLPFVNAHSSDSYCVYPWPDHFERYKELNKIPQDLIIVPTNDNYNDSIDECTYLILLSRQGFFYVNPLFWDLYTTRIPVYTVSQSGVPLVSIYKLK